jgi:hypothetical protein
VPPRIKIALVRVIEAGLEPSLGICVVAGLHAGRREIREAAGGVLVQIVIEAQARLSLPPSAVRRRCRDKILAASDVVEARG